MARQPRLFCFHHAGGGAAFFREWPKLFHNEFEIVAVQPGERYYSALVEENQQFVRKDFCQDAWQGPPEGAFSDATGIDLSKDFYPFGQQPQFNDTFYVACPDALARPGAVITLAVTLTNPPGAICSNSRMILLT